MEEAHGREVQGVLLIVSLSMTTIMGYAGGLTLFMRGGGKPA
jgi:hypothetical protein